MAFSSPVKLVVTCISDGYFLAPEFVEIQQPVPRVDRGNWTLDSGIVIGRFSIAGKLANKLKIVHREKINSGC